MTTTTTVQAESILTALESAGITICGRGPAASCLAELLGGCSISASAAFMAERGRSYGIVLRASSRLDVDNATRALVEAGIELLDAQAILANVHATAAADQGRGA